MVPTVLNHPTSSKLIRTFVLSRPPEIHSIKNLFRNGRVPALVDHTNGDYVIWESGAILLYLVERFDKENKLFATDLKGRTDIHTWLYFSVSLD